MNDLSFDQHQFYKPRSFPVEAHVTPQGIQSTGLSFQDAKYAQVQERARKNARFIPAFASSDETIRHVLLVKVWRHFNPVLPVPPAIDWHSFCGKMAEGLTFSEDVPAHKKLESAHHVEAAKKAGGVLEFYTAVAYRAWRLRLDSVAIAESTHCTPSQVRQILHRICKVARELGYETFPPHHSAGVTRGGRSKKAVKKGKGPRGPRAWIDVCAIAKLRQAGLSYTEIAKQLGASPAGIFVAERREKKKAGQESPASCENMQATSIDLSAAKNPCVCA